MRHGSNVGSCRERAQQQTYVTRFRCIITGPRPRNLYRLIIRFHDSAGVFFRAEDSTRELLLPHNAVPSEQMEDELAKDKGEEATGTAAWSSNKLRNRNGGANYSIGAYPGPVIYIGVPEAPEAPGGFRSEPMPVINGAVRRGSFRPLETGGIRPVHK